MRRTLVAATVAALVACSVAIAAAVPDSITATSKATSGGTKANPKAVSAGFVAEVKGADGRPYTPTTIRWSWAGVSTNGAKFPSCTIDDIDADQSDENCPKGARV